MNIKYLVNYIRTMRCYFYFLILQLIAVIALIFYVFVDYGNNHKATYVLGVECALTVIIIFEILIRMFTNKREFFDNIWNIIDIVGILVIMGLFFGFVFVEAKHKLSNQDDLIPAVLLATRYIAQVFRIVITLKQSQEIRNVADDHIVFNNEANDKSDISVHHSHPDMSIRV